MLSIRVYACITKCTKLSGNRFSQGHQGVLQRSQNNKKQRIGCSKHGDSSLPSPAHVVQNFRRNAGMVGLVFQVRNCWERARVVLKELGALTTSEQGHFFFFLIRNVKFLIRRCIDIEKNLY